MNILFFEDKLDFKFNFELLEASSLCLLWWLLCFFDLREIKFTVWVELFCDKKFINNEKFNIFKDMQKCTELNIHIINTNSLIDSYNENEIDLKSEKNIKFQKKCKAKK